MKEISVWGDISKEFARLGINPKCTWRGEVKSSYYQRSVYEISDDEYQRLFNDPCGDEYWSGLRCGWMLASNDREMTTAEWFAQEYGEELLTEGIGGSQ